MESLIPPILRNVLIISEYETSGSELSFESLLISFFTIWLQKPKNITYTDVMLQFLFFKYMKFCNILYFYYQQIDLK